MRILYVAMKYDYGEPTRGHSFEHTNFYDTLVHMGHDILYFDFMALLQQHGRETMNHLLRDVARTEKPDLLFSVLHADELDPAVIQEISQSETRTLNWFCDDHWRFEHFSSVWAPRYNWVVTTTASAVPRYEAMGYRTAIKSQWACNPFLYKPLNLPLLHQVTFVGQVHGNRKDILEALAKANCPVKAWGLGWPNGRLPQDEMIRVFNQSRINLNLSNASTSTSNAWWRRLLRRSPEYPQQLKGRDFEVTGCGGFLLTGRVEGLDEYYDDGKEVVCYGALSDLADKAYYYLTHDSERAAIARAGYERTRREHTYVHRFSDIFQTIGFSHESADTLLAQSARAGSTQEIL